MLTRSNNGEEEKEEGEREVRSVNGCPGCPRYHYTYGLAGPKYDILWWWGREAQRTYIYQGPRPIDASIALRACRVRRPGRLGQ